MTNMKHTVSDTAWMQSALSFIKSKGLETEFTDFCGGWSYPAARAARAYLASTKPADTIDRLTSSGEAVGWTSQANIDGLKDHDSFVIGSIINRPNETMSIPVFLAPHNQETSTGEMVLVPRDALTHAYDVVHVASHNAKADGAHEKAALLNETADALLAAIAQAS